MHGVRPLKIMNKKNEKSKSILPEIVFTLKYQFLDMMSSIKDIQKISEEEDVIPDEE